MLGKLSGGVSKAIGFTVTALWWLIVTIPLIRSYRQKNYVEKEPHAVRNAFGRILKMLKNINRATFGTAVGHSVLFFFITFSCSFMFAASLYSAAAEQFLHILRQFGFYAEFFSAQRVNKLQPIRMQCRPPDKLRLLCSVEPIACKRVPDGRRMNAYLMCPPRAKSTGVSPLLFSYL